MKKYFIILYVFLISNLSFSQNINHIFFGVNLNSDWYSLTNYSYLSYNLIDTDSTNKDPFVITGFQYSHNKISPSFLSLGFNELLLGFPRRIQSNLHQLKPEMLLARKNYKNIDTYLKEHKLDISKSMALIKQEFGNPKSSIVKDKYSVFSWKSSYYQIVLTSREEELTTTLIYIKQ